MRKCQNSTLEFKVENLKGGNSASRSVTRTHRRWSRAAAHRKAGEQQEPLRGFPLSSTQKSVQSVQSRAKKNLITSLWAWELSPLFSFTLQVGGGGEEGGCELLIVLSDCVSQQKKKGRKRRKKWLGMPSHCCCSNWKREDDGRDMREIMAWVKLCHISTVHNNLFYECQNNTAAVFSFNIWFSPCILYTPKLFRKWFL